MKKVIMFLILVYVLNLSATIIYIPEDQSTIQAGINVATDGDTVLVAPGIYNEYIDYESKDITVASFFLTTRDFSHISQTTLIHDSFPLVRFDNGESTSAVLTGFTLTDANVAIFCYNNSNPTLSYLNISQNCANFLGCGILCENSSPNILNCTFADNILLEPNPHGGAISARDDSHPVLVNSIVWNNSTPQISLWHSGSDLPSSITIAYCDIEEGEQGIEILDGTVDWLQGNFDIDPLFMDNFALQSGSPCIDSGTQFFELNNFTLVNLDSTQYVGSAPDMGAIEYNPNVDIDSNELFPDVFRLYQNFPNPFNPLTTISFSIQDNTEIKLSIYNINGQKIRTLANDNFSQGTHSIIWNGDDENGKSVASGIYYYKLNVNGKTEAVKKCLLLK